MSKTVKVVALVAGSIVGLMVLGFAAYGVRYAIWGQFYPTRGASIVAEQLDMEPGMMTQRFNSLSSLHQSLLGTETSYDDVLTQAVEDGTITQAQKTLIDGERELIQNKVADINNQQLTSTERENAFSQLMDDIYAWSNENDIPMRFLGFNAGGRMGQTQGMNGAVGGSRIGR